MQNELTQTTVLGRCPLADRVVEDQLITLNRLACLTLDLHLVPCAVSATFLQQLHGQAGHLTLLADVSAEVIALFLEELLALHVNNEVVTFELLNIGDTVVLLQELA